MPDSIAIRDAVPNEAAYLSALALRSKAHWGYSREFIRECENELTYQPSQIEDDNAHFVVAQRGSEIVGFYALEVVSARQFELVALFVEPEHIGDGVGRDLMKHALDNAAARSGQSILIQGDPNAERFYLAAGATQIGTRESGSVSGRFLPLFEVLIRTPDEDVV
ncbi:MAG: N-acetyltransferase [Chromatiales bacterium]|nr:MAG: N-acetyltransferase [Chromatiales bacterium]